jgi:hypothetical protein
VLRLFYWARLAYRNEEKLDYKWVNEAGGRALFGLDHAEALWDEDSDTHAVLGWSASAAVVAFRHAPQGGHAAATLPICLGGAVPCGRRCRRRR